MYTRTHAHTHTHTATGGDASLIDIADSTAPQTEPPSDVIVAMETPAKEKEEEAKTAASGELDDLEFWLATPDTSAAQVHVGL